MAFKVDVSAIKKRIEKKEEEREKNKNKKFDPSESPFLKAKEEGKLLFRAFPYPHSDEPDKQPFVERNYHYGIPGSKVFYCPQENDGEECVVCDFIWEQMKTYGGTNDEKKKQIVKEWASHLPKMSLIVPGKVRGREEEGPKLYKISTYKNKESDKVQSIWEWFYDEETANWLDPDEGFDVKIEFKKNGKFGISPVPGKLELSRSSSPFGDDVEEFVNKTPDIDKDIKGYEKKTSEDAQKVLAEWYKHMKKKVKVEKFKDDSEDDSEDMDINSSSEVKPDTTEVSDLESKLKELGV